DLFFVLSGFLICRWLLERGPSAEFYLRRAARTLPLYSLMLALFICGVSAERGELLHLPHLFGNAQYLWSYFALQQNNIYALRGADLDLNAIGVSWSLAIEEQFYLLFPLLFVFRRMLLLPVLIAAAAVSIGLRTIGDTAFDYYFTLCRLDGLAMGALVALALPHLARFRVVMAIIVGLLGVALIGAMKWDITVSPLVFTFLAPFYAAILALAILMHPRWLAYAP